MYVHGSALFDTAEHAKFVPVLLRQAFETSARRGKRRVDFRRAVRRGHEACLVSRGREIDAALEHGVEETIETFAVALHHLGEAAWRRSAEIDPEHAAGALRRKDDACLARFGGETGDQLLSDRFDLLLKTGRIDELQSGDARCNRNWISGKRACLVHRPERRELLHDVAAAADRAHWQAAANPFGEAWQGGAD